MNMKSTLGMLAMMAAMSEMDHPYERGVTDEDMEDNQERIAAKKAANEENLNRSKGLSKFNYGRNYLWALNEKQADKKATKKGWL